VIIYTSGAALCQVRDLFCWGAVMRIAMDGGKVSHKRLAHGGYVFAKIVITMNLVCR
jgi:hypothetical protein